MRAIRVPFSDLQNRGKTTIAKWLETEGGRPLRVTRRDAEDLVLMTAARAEQSEQVVAAATAVLRSLEGAADAALFRSAAVAAFPWTRLLSASEVDQFVHDWSDSLRISESLDNPAPAAQTIETWRHTAEIYADPELARALRSSTSGDAGPVPAPTL